MVEWRYILLVLTPKLGLEPRRYNPPTVYLHNYLLTPWSRVIFEKLTGSQLAKKFPAF